MRLGKKGPFELSAVMGEDFSQYIIPSRLIKQPKLLHSEKAQKMPCAWCPQRSTVTWEKCSSRALHQFRFTQLLPRTGCRFCSPAREAMAACGKGRTQFVSHRPLDLEMSSFLINASFVRIYMAPGFIQKLIFNSISHYYKFSKARFTRHTDIHIKC